MINRSTIRLFFLATAVLLQTLPGFANHHGKHCCPQCGCTEMQCVEVTQQQCKMVTEKVPVKKTVYETKQIPHCGHSMSGHHGKGCPQCAACPRMKTVLIKKEIKCGEKTETKCVAEDVVVLVPICCPKCGFKSHGGHHASASKAGTEASPIADQVAVSTELQAQQQEKTPALVDADAPPKPVTVSPVATATGTGTIVR